MPQSAGHVRYVFVAKVFKIHKYLCAVFNQMAWRHSNKRSFANIRRRSEAQHCSSLCSQSEGDEYCGGQTRLKIQRRYALKRWSCSLRVRGPHFASKVSYNAGASTDDYAGQRKSPLRERCCHFPNLYFSPTPKTKKSGYAHVGAWRSRIIYDCLSKRALRCIGNGKSGGLSVGDE